MSNRSAARGRAAASSIRLTSRTSKAVAISKASPSRCFLFCPGSRAARPAPTAAATVSIPPIPSLSRITAHPLQSHQGARTPQNLMGGKAVDLAGLDGVAQAVEPRPHQYGAAVAVVAEHMGGVEGPALGGMRADMGDEARELLVNGLVFDLVAGRNTAVDRYAHGVPPAGSGAPAPRLARAGWLSIAGGAGRPGPSAAGPWPSPCPCAGHAKGAAACSPPQ